MTKYLQQANRMRAVAFLLFVVLPVFVALVPGQEWAAIGTFFFGVALAISARSAGYHAALVDMEDGKHGRGPLYDDGRGP
jgi:hypothetical protein